MLFWSGVASTLFLLYEILAHASNLPIGAVMMSLFMTSVLFTIAWLAFVRPLSTRKR
ncbi:MAG: hypothetical protein QW057_03005 [Candidatus Bathyarchaeia archaeon]